MRIAVSAEHRQNPIPHLMEYYAREIIESGMNFSRRVAVRDQLAGGTRTAPTDSSLKYFVELQPPSTAIT
jgi:hypothetical protein